MQTYSSIIIFTLFLAASATTVKAQSNADEQSPPIELTQAQIKAQRWVSDDLITYLRAGPSANYRLVGTVLAGAQLQLLQTDTAAGYAQVMDERQRIGWLEIDNVSKTQSFRERVSVMETTLTQQNERLSSAQSELNNSSQYTASLNTQKTALNRQVTEQLEEIAGLREQLETQARTNSMQWFTRGAILGVSALIIGYIMGVLGRKRRSSGRLM